MERKECIATIVTIMKQNREAEQGQTWFCGPPMANNPGSGRTKANVHSERRDTGQKSYGFVIVSR